MTTTPETEVTTLKLLLQVASKLNSTLNLDELLQLIIGTSKQVLHTENNSIMLVDDYTGELMFYVVANDPTGSLVQHRLPPGQGIAGWVVQNGQPLVIDDPASDPRFYSGIDAAVGSTTRNILAIPLIVKDRTVGVMEATNKEGAAGFSSSDLELGEALASLAAVAIDNAQMYAKLTDAVVTARMSYRL